jgi:hypothetical protein
MERAPGALHGAHRDLRVTAHDIGVTRPFVRLLLRSLPVLLGVLLAACASPPARPPARSAQDVRAQLVQLLPASLADREGWAVDIERAFAALDVPPSTENLCAALAVVEQESTYVVDPVVPGLARIARNEIERRAAKLKIPKLVVRAALQIESPDGRTYAERLAAVRTERDLDRLYGDLISRVPLGQRLFGRANPVRTGGPMQVRIDFAERHAARHGYPYGQVESIREEVFTRRGGLHFGIAHLLQYPNRYERHLHRFADFNAGWYASRNAAFQSALTAATGISLALDGDLIVHGSRFGDGAVGSTERAARTLGAQLGLDERAIRRALELGDRPEFEDSELYAGVFALAERRRGALPRALVPQIALESPKISRKLTTAWFADRVQQRYQRCVNRAFGR